ncbi:SdpI family protein [Polaribacter sp.]|nr:SdpI family protein [Polaribacter sp.]MDC1262366.1 SdpI family protein [Polaribacter sp.]
MDAFTYVLTTNGLLFFVSILFWKFPPKKINKLYGYRTYRTMQNNEIWNFANATFNKNLIVYAGISFLAGLLFASLAKGAISWEPMVLVMLTLVVCIIKTEKSISELYDDEGEKLKTKR